MSTPSREALAAITRDVIERHDEWDSPHQFVTWHLDGERLVPGTIAIIDPAMHPDDYPALMLRLALERREERPEPPAYAFLLQIEAFGVTDPGKDATPQERLQFEADRRGRTFHTRPDAVESACAWCADVHGRLWTAAKRRDREGISEEFYQPGRTPGGQMIKGLLAVAYAAGMADHGLPGPQGWLN